MHPYPKVETLFDRDKETFRVIEGQWRRPEFALIDRWHVTEKIDGTNIRMTWFRHPVDGTLSAMIQGRTNRADIPKPLLAELVQVRDEVYSEVEKIMEEHDLHEYTLYGEGYGPGIQSGGYYRDTPGFILFDVKVGESTWLAPQDTWETATRLGIKHVPIYGTMMSTDAIIRLVRGGCESYEAQSARIAEGVVAKPRVPLYNARGERLVWKLKYRDFIGGKM